MEHMIKQASVTQSKIARWLAPIAIVTIFGIGAAACGSGSSGGASNSPTPSTSAPSGSSNGIPQGNVADNDSDNHGGPSDGDGNM